MGLRLLACLFRLPTAVIYGSLSLFVSILHNVFLLYYVDTFVSVYKIDKLSFWIGEVSLCRGFFCPWKNEILRLVLAKGVRGVSCIPLCERSLLSASLLFFCVFFFSFFFFTQTEKEMK